MRRLLALATMLVGFIGLSSHAVQAGPNGGLVQENVTGTLADGGSFTGKLTIQRIQPRKIGDGIVLVVTGRLDGTAQRAGDGPSFLISRNFTAPASDFTVVRNTAGPTLKAVQDPTCSILTLDIGRIRLNLLGLVIDLAPIDLDIDGQTGEGKLLGNLLCGLAGLLDSTASLSTIVSQLRQITDILRRL